MPQFQALRISRLRGGLGGPFFLLSQLPTARPSGRPRCLHSASLKGEYFPSGEMSTPPDARPTNKQKQRCLPRRQLACLPAPIAGYSSPPPFAPASGTSSGVGSKAYFPMFLLRFCSHPLSSHRRVFSLTSSPPQFPLRRLAPSCIAAACKADRQVGVWPIGRSLIGLAVGVLCPDCSSVVPRRWFSQVAYLRRASGFLFTLARDRHTCSLPWLHRSLLYAVPPSTRCRHRRVHGST